jgi:hypothetical protein
MLPNNLMHDVYAKVWKDAIGVDVTGFHTEFLQRENKYRIVIRMSHPLLPNQFLYSVIDISDQDVEATMRDAGALATLLDREQLLAIENTRIHIKKEVDKLAEGA